MGFILTPESKLIFEETTIRAIFIDQRNTFLRYYGLEWNCSRVLLRSIEIPLITISMTYLLKYPSQTSDPKSRLGLIELNYS